MEYNEVFENLYNSLIDNKDPLDEMMNSMSEDEIKELRKKLSDGIDKLFMEE